MLSNLHRAGNGTRTRDPNLGKVVLYQLSYSRNTPVLLPRPAIAQPSKLDQTIPSMEVRGIEPLTS